jgi:hypothetical protein
VLGLHHQQNNDFSNQTPTSSKLIKFKQDNDNPFIFNPQILLSLRSIITTKKNPTIKPLSKTVITAVKTVGIVQVVPQKQIRPVDVIDVCVQGDSRGKCEV